MVGYFSFIFVIAMLLIFAEITRNKGFENLVVKREISKNRITEGEEFKITTIVENNKWLPISFLLVREKLPLNIGFSESGSVFVKEDYIYHIGRYSVLWYERVKRTYTLRVEKRGAYLIKDINITLGDIFGFFSKEKELTDYIEVLVYPKLIDINSLTMQTTNFYGDNIIKRWIHKDPLYIKGIREYNVEDRMKDIHWKSSLKMNKLMVKDYDYTSEMEFVVILNVQCGDPYWYSINEEAVESGVKVAVSLASKAIKAGIPTGMWTNAQVVSYKEEARGEISPSLNSFKGIMELCARVDYSPRMKFEDLLMEKAKSFNRISTYIIVTPFLNDSSIGLIVKLRKAGFLIKIVDISQKHTVPSIEGIEKVTYRRELR